MRARPGRYSSCGRSTPQDGGMRSSLMTRRVQSSPSPPRARDRNICDFHARANVLCVPISVADPPAPRHGGAHTGRATCPANVRAGGYKRPLTGAFCPAQSPQRHGPVARRLTGWCRSSAQFEKPSRSPHGEHHPGRLFFSLNAPLAPDTDSMAAKKSSRAKGSNGWDALSGVLIASMNKGQFPVAGILLLLLTIGLENAARCSGQACLSDRGAGCERRFVGLYYECCIRSRMGHPCTLATANDC